MEFVNKSVLVIGMARSGISAAEKLKELGADVSVVDKQSSAELQIRSSALKKKGIKSELGPHCISDLAHKDLVIPSPGVPSGNQLIVEAKRREIPVWSEIELAYRLTDCPIIGITGTNGKTTTTMLIGEIFSQADKKGIIAGNIGFPLIKAIEQGECDTLIAELSSFQLENIVDFQPFISVLLNITEDHLDWHPDFADYVKAKKRLFLNQTENNFAVINWDDPIIREFAGDIKAHIVPFSKHRSLNKGVFIDKGKIIAAIGKRREICTLKELRIRGEHNYDNSMAAIAVSLIADIPVPDIRKTLGEFRGISHRIEFVATVNGVDYFNDSKATNPDATAKALRAFESPIVLLAGGRNKGNNLTNLVFDIEKKAKAVILFGEAAAEIYPLFEGFNIKAIRVESVPEAVAKAKSFCQSGDVVLFSPACASFDQFSNYEERGLVFKDAVMNLSKS